MGAGVTTAGANRQLARLAELLGSKSHDALPSDFPLAVATTGYPLPRELRALAGSSDTALVVGSKLGAECTGRGHLPLPAGLAQIDVDPAEIGRNYPAAVGIVADARLALEALLDTLGDLPGARPSRLGEVVAAREAARTRARRLRRVVGHARRRAGCAAT